MELLQALEQPAHLAIRVVDRFDLLLDPAKGVLGEVADRRWLPITE